MGSAKVFPLLISTPNALQNSIADRYDHVEEDQFKGRFLGAWVAL
jgi:hypothetical protein